MPNDVTAGGCPPASDWHDLLSDRVASRERESLERHLEECAHCLETLAGLAEGDSQPGGRTPHSPETAVGALSDSSRELLEKLADPRTFRAGLAEVARSQPVPNIEGLDDFHQVGRGGTGVVYRARQLSTNRLVAVKLLSLGPTRQASARILREAELLGRLRHPHVVTIHGSGVCGGTPYLLMEWVAGGTLQQRLERGEIPLQQAVRWTIELTQAVAAAHALGIVHRDLKPANVLLEPASEPGQSDLVKLTDFGLAQDQSSDQSLTWSGQVLGTPHYMAPEQTGLLPELGEPGPACDVYGLGAILFALLSGRPPHGGDSTSQTLLRVSEQEPPAVSHLRPEVPFDLTTIVAKCLRQHPDQRYASARELQDDLQRFVQGKPIMARPYPLTERIAKWVRRRPMSAVALGLLCALIGGSIWSNVRLGILGQRLSTLTREIAEIEKESQDASKVLDETRVAQSKAHEQFVVATSQLDTSRQELQNSQRLLDELQQQQQTMSCRLWERHEEWQRQTGAVQDLVFRTIVLMSDPRIGFDIGHWSHLKDFRERCATDLRLGYYQRFTDSELQRQQAGLLLDLGALWESSQAGHALPRPWEEAQHCYELVAQLTSDPGDHPAIFHMQLESQKRLLELSRRDDRERHPTPQQAYRTQKLRQLLGAVRGLQSLALPSSLTTDCLLQIRWGISHEAAAELAHQLTVEAQRFVHEQPGYHKHRRLLLERLGTQARLEMDHNPAAVRQIVQEMRRVAQQAQADFPQHSAEYILARMDTLKHWCQQVEKDRQEFELLEPLWMWREAFEELCRLGGSRLNGQILIAGRLIPLEAQLLQRRREWTAARELLTWFQSVTDHFGSREPTLQWQQAQARARIARARFDLLWGRRDTAERSLNDVIQWLSSRLRDPEGNQDLFKDWFHARLTLLEASRPGVPFEVLHRELLELGPHCPNESQLRFLRARFEIFLRAGQIVAAREVLTLMPPDPHLNPQVGEELNTSDLKACLESILEAADTQ